MLDFLRTNHKYISHFMAHMQTLAINTSRLVHKIQLSAAYIDKTKNIFVFYQCRYVTSLKCFPSDVVWYLLIYLFMYSVTYPSICI